MLLWKAQHSDVDSKVVSYSLDRKYTVIENIHIKYILSEDDKTSSDIASSFPGFIVTGGYSIDKNCT